MVRTRINQVGKFQKFRPVIFACILLFTVLAGAFVTKTTWLPRVKSPPSNPPGQTMIVPNGFSRLDIPGREPAFFSLKPVVASTFGILPRQEFDLNTTAPIEKEEVEKYLRSEIPMSVAQTSPTSFRLQPASSLGLGQDVVIRMAVKDEVRSDGQKWDRDYGWGFQTQGKFHITGSLPGDKKTDVPQNTGIEFVFSQDDYLDPTPLISVLPKIEFRTERHGQTFSLVPLQPLAPKTIYTVTLKKGLALSSRDDRITEDYIFSFQTAEPPAVVTSLNMSVPESFVQTSPVDPPVVKVYLGNWLPDTKVTTKIYKFNSGSDFIASREKLDREDGHWSRYYQEDDPIDVSGLGLVGQVDLTVGKRENFDFIQLPSALSEGHYLLQFWYDNGSKLQQVWLQSSDLSAYTTVGRAQTLVWVNDLASKAPVSQALVSPIGSGGGYYTSDNGVAVFSTPNIFYADSTHYLSVKSVKGQQIFLPVRSLDRYTSQNQPIASDYWSYIYHERNIYKPSDTVNYWGVIKHRTSGNPPSVVKVAIVRYGYQDTDLEIAAKNMVPNQDGTFMGQLEYADLPSGWYYLKSTIGDLTISQIGFSVQEFVKPEMKIEITADKKAIFTGETVNFTGALSFFDGTPGKQVSLSISENRSSGSTTKVTDNQGQISYQYTPNHIADVGYSHYPRYESIVVAPALSTDQTIEGFGNVMVYGSRLMLTSASSQQSNRATVKTIVNRVDLTGVNSGTSDEVKGSLVANAQVNLSMKKSWWERREDGTYYDYIEKVTRPSYRYEHREEVIPVRILTTNTAGEAIFDFEMEKDRTYTATLEIKDEDGRSDRLTDYFYYYENYQQSEQQDTTPKLIMEKKLNTYSLNESVTARITQTGKPYADTDSNRFLFIAAGLGRQDYFTTESPSVTFPFASKYIPNISLGAVAFTGSQYLPVSGECEWWYCTSFYDGFGFDGINLYFDTHERKLKLDIKTDKVSYQPGQTALVTVKVSQNDQPVSGAHVNTILVDQALAAIGGVVYPSPLGSLYSDVPNLIYYTYYSHRPALPTPSSAEKGGGGDGEAREIFKDTAFFNHVQTNQNGEAVFTVKLPDNITSWIVFSQAVTSGLDAGQTESTLPVTKDFFVTNESPREYLLSDKPNVTALGFGRALTSGDRVNYETYLLIDDLALAKQSKSEQAFKEVAFPLPSLQTGSYRLAVKGMLRNLTDEVIYPFSVIDSRFSFRADQRYLLSAGEALTKPSITGLKPSELVNVTVSDQGQGKYFHQLRRYCYTASNRLERWLTRSVAAGILEKNFSFDRCGSGEWDLGKFQNPDGGIAQVKWGGSDLETTVWAIRADADSFNKQELIQYLQSIQKNDSSNTRQKLLSAWGLIMLKHPQINNLNSLTQKAITPEEKLIAVLALISSGQLETARELYLDVLADAAYASNPYIRIEGKDANQIVKNSAWAILAGESVYPAYNFGFYSYLRDYGWQATDILIDLASISSIHDQIAALPQENTKVNLTTPSVSKTWDLSRGDRGYLTLKPSDIPSLQVDVKSGKAEVGLTYIVGSEGLKGVTPDDRLTITRTYKKAVGEGDIHPGDIVEIALQVNVTNNAPVGGFEITDYLPSGLMYLNNPGAYGLKTSGWMWQDNGQVILGSFHFYPKWQTHDTGKRVYYARAAFSGDYLAEPATFQSLTDLTVWQATGSDRVIIKSQ